MLLHQVIIITMYALAFIGAAVVELMFEDIKDDASSHPGLVSNICLGALFLLGGVSLAYCIWIERNSISTGIQQSYIRLIPTLSLLYAGYGFIRIRRETSR